MADVPSDPTASGGIGGDVVLAGEFGPIFELFGRQEFHERRVLPQCPQPVQQHV